MLVLTRTRGESIVIETTDGPITVLVTQVIGGKIKIGIDAPDHVRILRTEIIKKGKDE